MICVLICKAYMSLRELYSDFMATVAYNSHFSGTELQLKERLLGALLTVVAKCSVKMPTPSGTTNQMDDLISTFFWHAYWYNILGYTQHIFKWCFSTVRRINQTLFSME